MTAEQAGWTTVREYRLRVEGYEQEERVKWDRTRWAMFLSLQMQPFVKKGSKPRTPQAWIQFPWEKEEVKPIDKEACTVKDNEREQLNNMLRLFKDRDSNGKDR